MNEKEPIMVKKVELTKEEATLYTKILGNFSAYNFGKYSGLSIEEIRKSLEGLKKLELTEKFKEKFSSTSSFLNDEEKNRELERLERVALMVFEKSVEGDSFK